MTESMHNGSSPPPSTPPPHPPVEIHEATVFSSSPTSSLRSPRSPRRPALFQATPSPRPSSPGRIKALIAEDPLLSHLTPSTLSRMSTDDAMQFSPGEREVGVWAATARQKIEDWVVEVDGWENQCGWVKTGGEGFMIPPDDKGRKRRKLELAEKITTAQSGPPSPPVSRRLFDNVPPLPPQKRPKTPETPTRPSRLKTDDGSDGNEPPKAKSAMNTIDDLLSPTSTPLPMTKRLDLSLGSSTSRLGSILPGDSPDSGKDGGGPRRRSIQIGSLTGMHGTPTPTPSKRTTWDFSSLGNRSTTSPVGGFQPASPVAEVFDDEDEEDGEGEGANGTTGHDGTFYGSITGAVIDHYAARIESITSHLQQLDIESLKSRVLSYRTNSSGHELTDSEAVITATTLQLLPPLNKLSFLLEQWSNRLEVCRVVPTLLSSFDDAEYVIFSKGNDWLADYDEPGKEYSESAAQTLDDAFEKMKEAVEKRVFIAGRIVDGMLDMLDGKEETIPNEWIDRIEKLEEGLADWVLDQETRVWELKRTWRERKEQRLMDERLERERIERERLEQLERERLEKERLEQERLEQERLEQERLEQERLEKERLEQERLEQERLEQERLEQERLEAERLEAEKIEKERLEAERIEQERLEQERLEQERLEAERLEAEKIEQERLEAERLEAERIEQERLEQERLEQERLEQERLEQEHLEQERLEQERLEQERLEQERLENERLEQERIEQEKLEQERLEQERLDAEKAVAEAAIAAEAAEAETSPAEHDASESVEAQDEDFSPVETKHIQALIPNGGAMADEGHEDGSSRELPAEDLKEETPEVANDDAHVEVNETENVPATEAEPNAADETMDIDESEREAVHDVPDVASPHPQTPEPVEAAVEVSETPVEVPVEALASLPEKKSPEEVTEKDALVGELAAEIAEEPKAADTVENAVPEELHIPEALPADIALPDTHDLDGASDMDDSIPRITVDGEDSSVMDDLPQEHLPDTAYSDTHIDELEHHPEEIESVVEEDSRDVETPTPTAELERDDAPSETGSIAASQPLSEEEMSVIDHTEITPAERAVTPTQEVPVFVPAEDSYDVAEEEAAVAEATPKVTAEAPLEAEAEVPDLALEAPVEESAAVLEVVAEDPAQIPLEDEPAAEIPPESPSEEGMVAEVSPEAPLETETEVPEIAPEAAAEEEPIVTEVAPEAPFEASLEEEEAAPDIAVEAPLEEEEAIVPDIARETPSEDEVAVPDAASEHPLEEDTAISEPEAPTEEVVSDIIAEAPLEEVPVAPLEEESVASLEEEPLADVVREAPIEEEAAISEVPEVPVEEETVVPEVPEVSPKQAAADLTPEAPLEEAVVPDVAPEAPTEEEETAVPEAILEIPIETDDKESEQPMEHSSAADVPVPDLEEAEPSEKEDDVSPTELQTDEAPIPSLDEVVPGDLDRKDDDEEDTVSVPSVSLDGADDFEDVVVEQAKEAVISEVVPEAAPVEKETEDAAVEHTASPELSMPTDESILEKANTDGSAVSYMENRVDDIKEALTPTIPPVEIPLTSVDNESLRAADGESPLKKEPLSLNLTITPEAPTSSHADESSPLLARSSNLAALVAAETPKGLAIPGTHDVSETLDADDNSDKVSVTDFSRRLSIGSYIPSPVATRSTFADSDKPDILSTSFLTPHNDAFPGRSADDDDDAGSSISPVSPVSSEFDVKPVVKPTVVRQSSRPVSPIEDDEASLPLTPGLQFPFEDGEYFNRVGDARKPKVLDTRQELSPSPDFLSESLTRALSQKPPITKPQHSRIPSAPTPISAAAAAVVAKYSNSGLPKRSTSSTIPRYSSSRDEGLARTTRTHTRNTQSQDDISSERRNGATRKSAVSHMKTSSIPRLSTVISREEIRSPPRLEKSTMEKLPLKTMTSPEAEEDDDLVSEFGATFSPGGTLRRKKGNVGERLSLSGEEYRPPKPLADSPTTPVRRGSNSHDKQSSNWVVSPGSPSTTYPSSPDLDSHDVHVLKRKPKMLGKPRVILPDQTPTTSPTSTISPVLSSPGKLGASKFNITPPKPEPKPEFSLEDRVNSILTTLPASAKVKLTPSPMKPKLNFSKRDSIGSASSKPAKLTSLRSQIPAPRGATNTTTGAATTATGKDDDDASSVSGSVSGSSRRQHISNDIKMYHLHRPNGESPVKLFIRLVGEGGERVMVRVGGGWADLGAYLQEYASHHGSQHMNAAEAKIEVGDIIPGRSLRNSGSNSSLRSISSIGYHRSPTPGGSRPTSPLPPPTSRRNSIRATPPSGRYGGSESPVYFTSQSLAASRRGEGRESPSFNNARASPLLRGRLNSPTTPTFPSPTGEAPGSGGGNGGGRPSSRTSLNLTPGAYSNYRLPASRLSYGGESPSSRLNAGDMNLLSPASPPTPLGLAGPKSRKREISAEKQAWVERLEGQVRKVSAERSARFLQNVAASSNPGSNASLRSDFEGALDGSDGGVSATGSGTGTAAEGRARRNSRANSAIKEIDRVGGTRRVVIASQRPKYGALQSQRLRKDDAGSKGSLR